MWPGLRFRATENAIQVARSGAGGEIGQAGTAAGGSEPAMKLPLLLAALALGLPLLSRAGAEQAPGLDASQVAAVRITGTASRIRIATAAAGPFRASLVGTRSGWLGLLTSGWFFDDCRPTGRMWLDGTTLRIEIERPSLLAASDCAATITARLPEGAAVSIDQEASDVQLTGRFSSVRLEGGASDVALTGHAEEVSLQGSALRARLGFTAEDGGETIDIGAQSLSATLDFPPGTAVSYQVEGTAALVDSRLPNTPGAHPAITLSGRYVMATIR